ncbi:DUF937 domain-containing protein [Bradyrhizobium sp. SYSU BS000235]|uniref:DUF937 domain-containing protein n=1 Tax=Bradyrhizobium sp. SYSU BS000235 TaxID=3411332 RepID=UPI003C78CF87
MANLVSVVMQFLTPDMIAKIASALGLDRTLAQKAIGGAVPALLSSLADASTTPGGMRQLFNLLQQQSGSPESMRSAIGGSGQKAFADSGSSMLSGLFGGGALDTMAQSIGRFAGLNEGVSKSLLGMLAPVVLGALGQQQRTAGLDAGGVASLLASQKDQIVSAIPSGLADQLSAAGLIDRAGSEMASAADRTTSRVARAATSSPSAQWPYWLAALVVLGGLAWYFMGRPGDEKVAEVPKSTTARPDATVGVANPNLTVGGVNLTNQVNSSMGTLRSVLPGITDTASAESALPKIREAMAQLNDVSTKASSLSPEGKAALATLIAAATPTINQMCDKVLATPGVAGIAKPAIDELRSKLDALSRA